MTVASKLNIKPGQSVCVVGLPEGVDLELPADTRGSDDPGSADAVVTFARSKSDLAAGEEAVVDAAAREALAWLAYPKARQLGTDLEPAPVGTAGSRGSGGASLRWPRRA